MKFFKLIPNWRDWWKMNSVHVLGIIAAIPMMWMAIPEEVREVLPESWRPLVFTLLALGGVVARLRDQGLTK